MATVAINNGVNAGLLAIRILAAGMPDLATDMAEYIRTQAVEVIEKAHKLEEAGWYQYTQQ